MTAKVNSHFSTFRYFNGTPLVGRGRVSGGQVGVSGVGHEDEGMYQCFAKLGSQMAQDAAQLVIAGDRNEVSGCCTAYKSPN